jgi:hypothetical protein
VTLRDLTKQSPGRMKPLTSKATFQELLNSRPLDIHRWSDHPQVDALVGRLVSDIIEVSSRQRERDPEKLTNHVKVIVLDLYMGHQVDPEMYVGYSRRARDYSHKSRYNELGISYRFLRRVIDALMDEQLGYIEHHIGFKNRESGKGFRSRMRATNRLLTMFASYSIEPHMVTRTDSEEIIILRDSDKKDIEYVDTADTIRMRENLRLLNRRLDDTWVDLYVPDCEVPEINRKMREDPDIDIDWIDFTRKRLKRIFNNGSFDQGGRSYHGWWQEIPSEYRKHIHIDGKDVVELDYSGMHIRLLYAREGLDPPDDPYVNPRSPEYEREMVKKVLNTIINAESRKSALASIRKEIPREKYALGPGRRTVEDLVESVCDHNRAIEKYFYSGEGLKMQRLDSDIAERVMLEMADRKITVLPVHDSFLVQHDYAGDLEAAMHQAFAEAVSAAAKLKADKTARDDVEEQMKTGDAAASYKAYYRQLVYKAGSFEAEVLAKHQQEYKGYHKREAAFYPTRRKNR